MNKYFAIILILILVYIIYNNFFYKEHYEDGDLEINMLDMTENKIPFVLKDMLQNLHSLFMRYGITYWIDSNTLLGAVQFQDISPYDNECSISILANDEEKLLSLKDWLNTIGYNIVKFWSGYRIYPLNGINVEYNDRGWGANENSRELEDRTIFDYKYPCTNIYLFYNVTNPELELESGLNIASQEHNDKYDYVSKYVRRAYPNQYYTSSELFPLKKYQFDTFYLIGPNEPKKYLERLYGKDWSQEKYRKFSYMNQRMVPLVKFKVEPPIDKQNYL